DAVALVPATAPEEEPEMAQEELFPGRRSSPLGLHQYAVEPERPGSADPVDGSSQGEDHSLCEDQQRSQPLRIAEDDCQIHHRIWRSQGGSEMADNMELLHANCHRQIHVQERRTEA